VRKTKQIIKNILTLIFGYKYFIVVYQFTKENNLIMGNFELRLTRLHPLKVEYIKKMIGNSNECKLDDILIINIIRVGKLSEDF